VNQEIVWALLALGLLNLGFLTWVVLGLARMRSNAVDAAQQTKDLQDLRAQLQSGHERLERELRREIAESSQRARQDLSQNLATFQQTLTQQGAEATRTQNTQIDAFGQQLALMQKTLADTLHTQLSGVGESTARRLAEMSDTNTRGMTAVRDALNQQLVQLQTTNSAKLDEMRATVDEKLQTTLQARLGESFKQVADRLEQVHKGLGEMQTLAQGVGDLKHLLTNVKTRGIFGEAQLASLLEQVFVPDQYAVQVATRPGSKNVVDFAIKLPGKSDTGAPLWLPIDAKFPNEDYERLLDAQGAPMCWVPRRQARRWNAHPPGSQIHGRKYVEPPHTTDFAILFLPTEGLYAEVLRRPGLMESLQRDHRVTLAGPTTLLAMLSSLQMGFRTLALEKRSSEVWQVLGAVKTEFEKFGGVLAKVKSQTQTVLNTLDNAETRSRALGRVLKKVDALPDTQAQALIPFDKDFDPLDGEPDAGAA
jgi:DNA recombination protein RmuC